jgi:DNA-directed RNA polymerase specialized sigma24 family protein
MSRLITRVELLGGYSKLPKPLSKRFPDASGKPHRSRPLVHAARRRLTAHERSQLAADYEAGRSTTWLMRSYHLGKGTVLNILAEQDVKMRGQGIPDDQLDDIIELYRSGLSLMRISKKFNCSAETVRQALLNADVTLRRQWERAPL